MGVKDYRRECWPVLKRTLQLNDAIRTELQNIVNLEDAYHVKPIDDAIEFNQPPDVLNTLLELGANIGEVNRKVTYDILKA